MYRLYQALPVVPEGAVVVPHWSRVQQGLRMGVEKVIDYHRRNPQPLDGNHLLVRLLDSISVSKSLPLDTYHDKVVDLTYDIAATLRMTSAYHRGKVFDPAPFYGANVAEVVIATTESYDLNQMRSNWRSMRPIRVLYHPFTDLSLGVPNGKTRGTEGGPAVVCVNVPMLAAQYRMWSKEENELRQDSKRTAGQFLQQYPLANMMYSHVDHAIINRLIARYFQIDMPEAQNPHSFFQVDWTSQCDHALDQWLKYWRNKRSWTFDSLISQFPQVFSSDYHKVMRAPEASYLRQLQWSIVVARVAMTSFLVHLNEDTGNPANTWYLSQLRTYLRHMDIDKLLRDGLNDQRHAEMMSLINTGITPYL